MMNCAAPLIFITRKAAFITQDRNMLGGILDLQDLEILDAMIHRTKMVTIDAIRPD